ncbi:uncharacterized protein LOC130992076 [Salvia miltiorrhiza]|uniref:uncharacterized protein LOC130992076 n=1 Tax=Salvia miltiorrhiza TaxID=226208 RepID=UPI0025ACF59C|nr:uncharacterized protein LOC130992076 [Salvia miltiorrhiza]
MRFTDYKECKDAVVLWAIINGYNIKWTRSSKIRLEAECFGNCPWMLYASKLTSEPTFVIKSYHEKHTCIRALRNRQVKSDWVASQLVELLKRSPNLQGKEIQKELKIKFGIDVTIDMCYKAKEIALEKIRGSFVEDYKKLRSYVLELMKIDKEGKFVLKTLLNKEDQPVFHRFFIGFSALKKGFFTGCRRLICFDACFLKTVLRGVLLAAVGKDCNYKMYPIAWAVVEKENEESWSWFCENLFEEFGIIDGFGWSFMSDKQKGLINAIQKLAPNGEHRHCARHVYANWKKKFGGSKFKSLFWKCAKSNTTSQFQDKLEQLKKESTQAFEDFCTRNPRSFCKSLLSSYTKTDIIDNNICESFNSFILQARDKPILHMLEDIRKKLMSRMHDIANSLDKSEDELCPNVRIKLNKIESMTRYCDIRPAVGSKFEVQNFEESYIVDLGTRECNCREWELTGLPCCHALACINYARDDIISYVDPFYLKNTCVETYKHGLEPIHGEKDWPIDDQPPIIPPKFSKLPGRPKKLRKRDDDEVIKDTANKLSRRGLVKMTCKTCGMTGHNKRSCRELPSTSRLEEGSSIPIQSHPTTLRTEAI